MPRTEVLIFTIHDAEILIRDVFQAGALGYLLKADAKQYVVAAVEALAEHKPFFTARVLQALLASFLAKKGATAGQLLPTGFDNFRRLGYQGDRLTRGERNKLHSAAREKRIAAEKKGVRPLAHHGAEGCMDFLRSGGFEDLDFQANGAHSRFEVPYRGLHGRCVGRIHEYGHTSGSGDKLMQKFQPFCRQFTADKVDAGHVAARP
jgi:hypothetical protein